MTLNNHQRNAIKIKITAIIPLPHNIKSTLVKHMIIHEEGKKKQSRKVLMMDLSLYLTIEKLLDEGQLLLLLSQNTMIIILDR